MRFVGIILQAFFLLVATAVNGAQADSLLAGDDVRSSQGQEGGGEVSWDAGEQSLLMRAPASGPNRCFVQFFNQLPMEAGSCYGLSFQMRVVKSETSETGQGGVTVTLSERSETAWEISRGSIERQTVAITAGAWEDFRILFRSSRDYSAGAFQLDLRPSYFREALEFRQIELRALGDAVPADFSSSGQSYPGQSIDADWRAEADARIRAHRMADLHIEVVDEWGNPVQGAMVDVAMQRHAYLFGTCVKAARITDAEVVFKDADFDYETYFADNVIYRQKLRELFNFAVFENDMKWPFWAGRRTDRGWTQKVTLDAVDWLRDHQFEVKSHTMMWGSWRQSPEYLQSRKDDPEALRGTIHRHIRDQAEAFAGKVDYADVLNEAMSHNDLIEVVGWEEVPEWFRLARKGMPGTRLVINEFDILGNGGSPKRQEQHEAFIRQLLDAGAPIDLLGFQSHFWSTRLTPPERLYQLIERFGQFGLPMMVSEFDMNLLDERLQADYTRDFLKVWFSHPQTEAFIMWGFWAKAHWFGEPGAMFRADWSPKPNLAAYTDLVFGEWWTEETLSTDAKGRTRLRVFKGDYEITVSAPGYHTATRRPRIESEHNQLVVLYPESD